MKTFKLCQWIVVLALILVAVPGAAAGVPQEPDGSARFRESSGGVESISMSWVGFDQTVGGDKCSVRNASQTFCYEANSYTDDWDYVYYLYMRFPDGWSIHNVYLQGTPICSQGGTFGAFSWAPVAGNEVRIEHIRYHANPSDLCTAYYCFEVTSDSVPPSSDHDSVSWYWISSGVGSPPYYPCSNDGYTPTGQPACDEMIHGVAVVWQCESVKLPIVSKRY